MLVVVKLVGKASEIRNIPMVHGGFQNELVGSDSIQNVDLGNGLSMLIGDASRLLDQPKNFTITNGMMTDDVHGNAAFIRRFIPREEVWESYESLSHEEADALLTALNDPGNVFDVRKLYAALGM